MSNTWNRAALREDEKNILSERI